MDAKAALGVVGAGRRCAEGAGRWAALEAGCGSAGFAGVRSSWSSPERAVLSAAACGGSRNCGSARMLGRRACSVALSARGARGFASTRSGLAAPLAWSGVLALLRFTMRQGGVLVESTAF